MSTGWTEQAAGGDVEPDLLALVDPELVAGALQMRAMTASFTPMSAEKLAMRRALLSREAPLVEGVPAECRVIAGPPDAPDLPVWVVNHRDAPPRPAILHMHGGGFTASTARASVPAMQVLAAAVDCVIVSVDYRNAPEARWDQAIEDDNAALVWLHANAVALGVDPARIAIMGDSGGGGHAALLAVAARDRGQVPVMFQLLVYPMLDDRTGTSRAMPRQFGAFGWNADANRFGWRCFLGMEPGGPDVPAAGVPARQDDLAGLPPTFIVTGGLDLFASEDIEHARRLNEAGVPTELLVIPGAYHGFDRMSPESGAARRFEAARRAALHRAFGTAPG